MTTELTWTSGPGGSAGPGGLGEPAEPREDRLTDEELAALARRARGLVMRTAHTAGAGHVGGSLSVADLLVTLYFDQLRIDPTQPAEPGRDRFVLSKGHCGLGLYVVLAMRGFFPEEELATFDRGGSRLQMHPDMLALPGIEISTGSLGQGLSAAVGMALGARLRGLDSHVWAVVGDGELQEGMVWEALHVAPRYQLGNLTLVLDANRLQQYGWTPRPEDVGDRRDPWAHADLAATFTGLGWRVLTIDGHDVGEIRRAYDAARAEAGSDRPTAIIASTLKGKGISFTEGTIAWHTAGPSEEHLRAALAELEQAVPEAAEPDSASPAPDPAGPAPDSTTHPAGQTSGTTTEEPA